MIKRLFYITCYFLILISCNKNSNIHKRKWEVYNPCNDSYSIKVDTFNTKFVKEIGVAKFVLDSMLHANCNELGKKIVFANNNIVIEAKKEISDQNKKVEVFRISSYNSGVEMLFIYSVEYGVLLKYILKRQYALEEEFTYRNEHVKSYKLLIENVKRDTNLMVITKMKFSNN